MNVKTNLSFAGSGFLGLYYIGVSACLKKLVPYLLTNKIGGASSESLTALALVCDIPLADISKAAIMLAFDYK